MNPRVAIFMAVRNGAAWLDDVLQSVFAQDYTEKEVTLWDNASTDATPDIAQKYPDLRYIRTDENIGFWTAMERLIEQSDAPYIVCLTDVVLDRKFLSEALRVLERDKRIGAVQGKIYQRTPNADGSWQRSKHIDALGFQLHHSRRVTILGHGEEDVGQYDKEALLFGVEGAVPVFRRAALDDSAMPAPLGTGVYRVSDPMYRVEGITYADDFDLAWRMTLLGWRQVLVPTAQGWHDRSTTSDIARSWWDHVRRIGVRRNIDRQKRRLDWSNTRFTIIKNDHIINILRDLPRILAREIMVQVYLLLFEPRTLLEWGRFLRLLPRMLVQRRILLSRARVRPSVVHALMS